MGVHNSRLANIQRPSDVFSMPEFPTEGIEIGPPTHIKESQLIDKFSAVWSVRDENGEWTPVSQGFFFIPRKQDIGHSIKVDVYPIRYHLKRPNPAEKNQMPTIDIIHVHNELVQVRSKLTPLDQACLDKQILYSLDGSPSSEFFEMELIDYHGTGMQQFRRNTLAKYEKIAEHAQQPRRHEHIPQDKQPADDLQSDVMKRPSTDLDAFGYNEPCIQVNRGDVFFSVRSENPVRSLKSLWLEKRFGRESAEYARFMDIDEPFFADDEIFRLDQQYSIYLQDHLSVMQWHCTPPVSIKNSQPSLFLPSRADQKMPKRKKFQSINSKPRNTIYLDKEGKVYLGEEPDNELTEDEELWRIRAPLIVDIICRRQPDVVCLQEIPIKGVAQFARLMHCLYDGAFLTILPPKSVMLPNDMVNVWPPGYSLDIYREFGNGVFWKRARMKMNGTPFSLNMFEKEMLASAHTMATTHGSKNAPEKVEFGGDDGGRSNTLPGNDPTPSPPPFTPGTPASSLYNFSSPTPTLSQASRVDPKIGGSDKWSSELEKMLHSNDPAAAKLAEIQYAIGLTAARIGLCEMRSVGVILEPSEFLQGKTMYGTPLTSLHDEKSAVKQLMDNFEYDRDMKYRARKEVREKEEKEQIIREIEEVEQLAFMRDKERDKVRLAKLKDVQEKNEEKKTKATGTQDNTEYGEEETLKNTKGDDIVTEGGKKKKKRKKKKQQESETSLDLKSRLLELPSRPSPSGDEKKTSTMDAIAKPGKKQAGVFDLNLFEPAQVSTQHTMEVKDVNVSKMDQKEKDKFEKEVEAEVEELMQYKNESDKAVMESTGQMATSLIQKLKAELRSTENTEGLKAIIKYKDGTHSSKRSRKTEGMTAEAAVKARTRHKSEVSRSEIENDIDLVLDSDDNTMIVVGDDGRFVRANLDGSQKEYKHRWFTHTPVRTIKIPHPTIAQWSSGWLNISPWQHKTARRFAYQNSMNSHFTGPQVMVTSSLTFGDGTFGEDIRFAQVVNLIRAIYFRISRSTWGNGIILRSQAGLVSIGSDQIGTASDSSSNGTGVTSALSSQIFPLHSPVRTRVPIIISIDTASASLQSVVMRMLLYGMETSLHPSIRHSPVVASLLNLPSFVSNPFEMKDMSPQENILGSDLKEIERRVMLKEEYEEIHAFDVFNDQVNYFHMRQYRDGDLRDIFRKQTNQDLFLKSKGILSDDQIAENEARRSEEYQRRKDNLARWRKEEEILMKKDEVREKKLMEMLKEKHDVTVDYQVPSQPVGTTIEEDYECYDKFCGAGNNHLPIRARPRHYSMVWDPLNLGERIGKKLTNQDVAQIETVFPVFVNRKRDGVLCLLFDPTVDFTPFFTQQTASGPTWWWLPMEDEIEEQKEKDKLLKPPEPEKEKSEVSVESTKTGGTSITPSSAFYDPATNSYFGVGDPSILKQESERAKKRRLIRQKQRRFNMTSLWVGVAVVDQNSGVLRLSNATRLSELIGPGAMAESAQGAMKKIPLAQPASLDAAPPYTTSSEMSSYPIPSYQFSAAMPYFNRTESISNLISEAEGNVLIPTATPSIRATPHSISDAASEMSLSDLGDNRGMTMMDERPQDVNWNIADSQDGFSQDFSTASAPADVIPIRRHRQRDKTLEFYTRRGFRRTGDIKGVSSSVYVPPAEVPASIHINPLGLLPGLAYQSMDNSPFSAQLSVSSHMFGSDTTSVARGIQSGMTSAVAPKNLLEQATRMQQDFLLHPSLPYQQHAIEFHAPFQMTEAWSYVTGMGTALSCVHEDDGELVAARGDCIFSTMKMHPIATSTVKMGYGTPEAEVYTNTQERARDRKEKEKDEKDLADRKERRKRDGVEDGATGSLSFLIAKKSQDIQSQERQAIEHRQNDLPQALVSDLGPAEKKEEEDDDMKNEPPAVLYDGVINELKQKGASSIPQLEEDYPTISPKMQQDALRLDTLLFPSTHRPVTAVFHRFWEDNEDYAGRVKKVLKKEFDAMLDVIKKREIEMYRKENNIIVTPASVDSQKHSISLETPKSTGTSSVKSKKPR